MFGMNITAWGERPAELGLCSSGELRELAAAMASLSRSPASGEITWAMHQAAYARGSPDA
jgi:hypothetical protein